MHSFSFSLSGRTSSAFGSLRSSHAGIFSIRYRLRHEIRDSDVTGQRELGNIQGKWHKQGEYNDEARVDRTLDQSIKQAISQSINQSVNHLFDTLRL